MRALLSVWDKSGIVDAATRLADAGVDLVATGGTAKAISNAGLSVIEVSDATGFPEILDGRVKTLHPAIHAGLLARRDLSEHMDTLSEHEIAPVNILISNLYPFSQVIGRESFTDEEAIEHIDIGGPAMLRAAAKNYVGVIVLVDPEDYEQVLDLVDHGGVESVSDELRRKLAAKAFAHVAAYDSLIASYLREDNEFPADLSIPGRLLTQTSYGENPHQQAAVYSTPQPGGSSGVATWSVHQDKELSYNNYLDAASAWGCVRGFEEPAAVIVKHNLPCGVGLGADLVEAYLRALSGDPVSAFGGILATNRPIDIDTAEAIGRQLLHVVIAPGYTEAALERLARKRSLRIVTVGNPIPTPGWDVRSVPGGLLIQDQDRPVIPPSEWTVVTRRKPTEEEWWALAFAWQVVPWVKSNAIVLAQDGVVTGIGAGQPNRVESVRIAVNVAGERASGSVLAGDAFFPFADGVEVAAEAGVTAIAQPGGSLRDDETIAAADAAGIAMVFTGERHFRH